MDDVDLFQLFIGVSVFVKGSFNVGIIIDFNGVFFLNVEENVFILIFFYIGYNCFEVFFNGWMKIDICMSEFVEVFDEVVVIVVGIECSKKVLGYFVEEVGGEELVSFWEINLVNVLSLKVVGVQVISSLGNLGVFVNIVICGWIFFNENFLLFIIDGVFVDNSFVGLNFIDQFNWAIDINFDDIEIINVFKGGVVIVFYGVCVVNGVVFIIIKKG